MSTKKAIQKEFMHEYSQREYSRITVKTLCANTPVARTTFYSYYQNIDELKNDIEDNLINGIIYLAQETSQGNMAEMDFSLFFAKTMDYIKEHWNDIYTFLIIQPNIRFIQKWKEAIKKHFSLRFPQKTKMSNYDLISESMASAVIGAYSYWLKYPETVDIRKLNQIVVSSLESTMNII